MKQVLQFCEEHILSCAIKKSKTHPDRLAYTFLAHGETEAAWLTYGELDLRARAIGAELQRAGAAGERALLLYPPGLEFVAAYFGCLYAGAVAVPAYPPRSNRTDSRLQAIFEDSQPRFLLSSSASLARTGDLAAQHFLKGSVRSLATDILPADLAGEWRDPGLRSDSLAMIQYTSGSTAQPKGVMVTHGNLVHNQEMIRRAFGQSEDSVVVGWLPLYHDMGLIGNVLQPLYAGARCVLMSPLAFIQKPLRWLQAVTRYGATTSGGPNFAYDLCVRKIPREQREGLDLSRWSLAFNGAEPVRHETLERFAEAFAPQGFRCEAFYPCYGLAEATLFAAGGQKGRGPVATVVRADALEGHQALAVAPGKGPSRTLVSCGGAWMDQEIVVADPHSREPCPPGWVGEIWLAGPSVARGYWNHPGETEERFHAALGGARPGRFLRTGDLGFLQGSELYVTGRVKDLIIIRGRNHYPQDIELTVQRTLAADCAAAFPVEADGEERLVVVCELRRPPGQDLAFKEVAEALRQAVAEEHELQLHELVLVPKGGIPKTSSGKLQRHRCREDLRAGRLTVLARSTFEGQPPAPPVPDLPERHLPLESRLRERVSLSLRVPAESLDDASPLAAFGLDSLAAAELQGWIETEFDVPVSLAGLLEGLSLGDLAREIGGRLADTCTPHPLPGIVRGDSGPLPLSYAQKTFWFLERLNEGSGAYQIAAAARVRSALDVPALRRACAALSARHSALRTTFHDRQGEPVQAVHQVLEPDFLEEELPDEERLLRRLEEEAYRPFDLARGPLLRIALFRRPGESVLLFAVHHLVADFWALVVLARELGALYAAETAGGTAGLPPVLLEYGDAVVMERRYLAEEGERSWHYWREQLAGDLPVLGLATDRPRSPGQSRRGALRGLRLGSEIAAALRSAARAEGSTLYMALLAVFQTLLWRYTRQDDVILGSPMAARTSAVFSLVGLLTNPVVLRTRLAGDPAFAEGLRRARRTVLGALEHQRFPLALVAERLQPDRESAGAPLFQALFVMQKAHLPEMGDLAGFALGEAGARLDLGGMVLESMGIAERWVQYDLTLVAAEREDEIGIALEHSADTFDPATIGRVLQHFATLAAAAAANPRQPISGLPLLSGPERHQVVREWSLPGEEPLAGAVPLIHDLVAAQAARTPGAIAVVCGERSLTYRELHLAADRLARRLARLGVGPETRVGVCLERSLDLVVALLGTVMAGGAYVPLDPEYPRERLAFLLDDSRAAVLLTRESLLPILPACRAVRLLIDEPEDTRDAGNPPWPADVRNLAYVIYTSGSTGRPKGVMVSHEAICGTLLWRQATYPLGEADAVLQAVSIGFDASLWEVFGPLIAGARMVLAEPGAGLDLGRLAATIRDHGVTLFQRPPSLLSLLLEEPALREASGVRHVICGGEPLTVELASRFAARHGARLHNLYGPAEASLDATGWTCRDEAGPTVPIGRPVAGKRVYLLDPSWQPVPAGVPGEICLGGEGLARGYLNRPELTAESFVPDPLSGTPGARIYRTGDLGRHRPDGILEFLGRVDDQVKIRGVRIELGEVEAALRRQPGLREAAVVVRESPPGPGGGHRLVAYLVSEPGRTVDLSRLRDALRAQLPAAMIPAAFVVLAELPMTAHGKVDRQALPEPGPPAAPQGLEAPRGPIEELVAGMWQELLGLPAVGRDDDFFALGGHSLAATRLLARFREAFGVELPLRSLFQAVTVADQARRIEEAVRAGEVSELPPVERSAPGLEPPLSFAQERLWFLHQMDPGSAAYNIAGGLRLQGPLDASALTRALGGIVRRHEVLRTTFPAVDGGARVVVGPAVPLRVPLVDLRGAADAEDIEREARRLAREEARQPFDLARGPLLRAALLRLAGDDHLLLLTLHHIVSDGWSTGILLRELGSLYGADRAGAPPALRELSIQYSDFALWQRQGLVGERLERLLGFWRQRLAGAPQVLELPADRPVPAAPDDRGASVTCELPLAARDAAQGAGATLLMVLLAAFHALLGRYTGQDDVSVGTPVSGRGPLQTEELIGLFVNTLVLRLDLGDDPSLGEVVRRAREAVLEAHRHQDLPFDRLVDELQPARSLGHTPLIQTMLSLQDAAWGELAIPGLRSTPFAGESGSAKLDLSLLVTERAGALEAVFEYRASRFDPATIVRLARHYQGLLGELAAHPGRRLSEAALLAAAERQQLLVEWNEDGGRAGGAAVHHLIEARAKREPDAVAVRCGEQRLTYGELDAWAERIAEGLASLGAGPEAVVGLCAGRGVGSIAGLLGIFKSGAAYLPLDPEYPGERLAWMMEDSGLRLLLTEGRLRERLPVPLPGRVLDLEAARTAAPVQRRLPEVAPGNLAYVIYTSGSTGRPRGVQVQHAALGRHCLAACELYRLGAEDRFLQFASLSFDASLEQILCPLMAGATIVMRDSEVWSVAQLAERVVEDGITVLNFPPAYWQQLVREAGTIGARMARSLRLVIVGGDLLDGDLVRCWQQGPLQGVRLLNAYGPTEAVITAATFEVPAGRGGGDFPVSIPIGRPVSARACYVLDRRLSPVPLGAVGELYIGGPTLARCYLGLPAATAEKLVPDPFGASPGGRLYRTGDRVRHLPRGDLQFLGRIDDQVKVRGFRIEPGEVEAALRLHPAVEEAVVLAPREPGGDGRLTAWLVVREGAAPAPAELRRFLAEKLPPHLIPSAFIPLAALPLTPSGKVDRRALAEATASSHPARTGDDAPRTAVEAQLAEIWSHTLGVERVGIHDNFFALGGDSILSIQIVARARQAGLGITPRQMFHHQTIEELAAVAGGARVEAEQGLVTGPVAMTPLQRSFFASEPANPHHFNQALLLQVRNGLEGRVLERAVEALLPHHDMLRLRAHRGPEGWRLSIVPAEARSPWSRIDLSALPAAVRDEAMGRAIAQLHTSLDLTVGPILRAGLFDRGAGEAGRLLLVAHHLAVDGVSWRILLEDLETACRQLRGGGAVSLPPKTTSFQEWSRRLGESFRMAAHGGEGEATRPLPRDRATGANTVASVRSVSASLTAAETDEMLRQVPRLAGLQIEAVLLAALARALAPWVGDGPLVVDVERHGREAAGDGTDVTRTVGWFTSVFPLRLEIGSGDPGETLEMVKAGLGRRNEAASGRAEVAFNYLGRLDQVLNGSEWFAPAPEPSGPARDPGAGREHLLEISGGVLGGRLDLAWSYSEQCHRREVVEELAGRFVRELRDLIAHCRSFRRPPLPMEDEAGFEALAPVSREEDLPLSFSQQRLWFLDQLAPGSSAYNLPVAMRLTGVLSVSVLERTLSEIVRRHESLRTTFATRNGSAVQVIGPPGRLSLPLVDLGGLDAAVREREARRLADEEGRRPFDLGRGPLMRVLLLRLDAEAHEVLTTAHHIISDAWSMGVLISEVASLYPAFLAGRPSPLPELPLQYADFAHWQRRWMRGEVLAAELSYWRAALAGAPTLLDLPASGPPPAVQTDRGAVEWLPLPAGLNEKLKALARQEGATLYMVLLAAYFVLLHDLTGRRDILVGTSSANRNRPEIEGMIGFFVNLLVIRGDLAGPPTFREVLARVRETVLEAFAHQNLPFEKLVEEVPLVRQLGRNPLVQVVFTFENAVGKVPSLPDLTLTLRPPDFDTALFDLALIMEDSERGLMASLRYKTDLFQRPAVARILRRFESLLSHVAAQPDLRLDELVERLASLDRQERAGRLQELEAVSVNRLKLVRRRTAVT